MMRRRYWSRATAALAIASLLVACKRGKAPAEDRQPALVEGNPFAATPGSEPAVSSASRT